MNKNDIIYIQYKKDICGGKILCRPHADGKQGESLRDVSLWHAYHISSTIGQ